MNVLTVPTIIRYLIEGMAVAIVAHYIPKGKLNRGELTAIALTAAATLAVLDTLSPEMASGARLGAGAVAGARVAGATV